MNDPSQMHEQFMSDQRELRSTRLILQEVKYGRRNVEEMHKLVKPFLHQDFTVQSETVDLSVSTYIIDPMLETFIPIILENWKPLVIGPSPSGISLKNKVIKTHGHVGLRTLAISIGITLSMTAMSDFLVFTRCEQLTDSTLAVVRLSSMTEDYTTRFFLMFGTCKRPSNEFVFFKSQEVPGLAESELINLTVIDNGDDKVYAEIRKGRKVLIESMCDMFVPTFDELPLMLAGAGQGVFLREMFVKHVRRRIEMCKHSHETECCVLL